MVRSDKTPQAYDSRTCGHYAFVYLQERVGRRSLLEFVEAFRYGNYVWNDQRVGERVRAWIQSTLGEAALDEADGLDAQRALEKKCFFFLSHKGIETGRDAHIRGTGPRE